MGFNISGKGGKNPGFIESVRSLCDSIESKPEVNITPIPIGLDSGFISFLLP